MTKFDSYFFIGICMYKWLKASSKKMSLYALKSTFLNFDAKIAFKIILVYFYINSDGNKNWLDSLFKRFILRKYYKEKKP